MSAGSEITLLSSLSAFLAGTLITMIIFVFRIMDRLSKQEQKLDNVAKIVENLDVKRPICPMHEELKSELAQLRQAEALTEQRVQQHTG